MGIRNEQREKRRQEILTAALDLFIRRGYAATKISDIAQNVGMSVGLLFHYYESKEKLYESLIRSGVSGPMSAVKPTEEEPLRFFEDTAGKILHSINEQPFIAKMFVLMNRAFYNDAAPQGVKDLLRGFDIFTPTSLLIKKGQANGTIRVADPDALSLAYWCAIQGIAEQMAVHPDLPCPESDWIVDMIRNPHMEVSPQGKRSFSND
jgi:AcrR family transcriptional regulator